ncbi:MAG: 3-dehydroquinate synthase [Planctomycetes bacterium]|nr:3-dehydroquinate synthase [Planctomycetota bacterium]
MAVFVLDGQDGRRSRIEVARGLEGELESRVADYRDSGLFLLHDPELAALAGRLADRLRPRAVLAATGAESAKNLREVERLAGQLLAAGADRQALLLVLGGGALLDLGSFLAGTYFRGIACALLPTTLLAMVDAAVGGKSAVDLGPTKNVLGLFRQPDLVLADSDWLATLSDHHIRQGLAELIKMAAILDEEVFHHLEGVIDDLRGRDPDALEAAVVTGVRLKVEVVRDDEREAGRRIMLNYGHSLGHALETVSNYRVPHGDAVAIGMIGELEMVGLECARIEALLASAGLPIAVPAALRHHGRLWKAMTHDKKTRAGEVRVAVPERIGQGVIRVLRATDLERLR